MKLYLDDNRIPIEQGYTVVKNYDEFVDVIEKNGMPEIVYFDHDLSYEHSKDFLQHGVLFGTLNYEIYTEKTGLDCAKFLCDYAQRNNILLCKCIVHSHNTIGSENIVSYINNYLKHVENKEPTCVKGHIDYRVAI